MTAEKKRRCKGFKRHTGERCNGKAVKGSDYCRCHGGQAVGHMGRTRKGMRPPRGTGAPKGNTNAL